MDKTVCLSFVTIQYCPENWNAEPRLRILKVVKTKLDCFLIAFLVSLIQVGVVSGQLTFCLQSNWMFFWAQLSQSTQYLAILFLPSLRQKWYYVSFSASCTQAQKNIQLINYKSALLRLELIRYMLNNSELL